MMKYRIFKVAVILAILLWPSVTKAINAPISPTLIVSADAYRHLIELNDLLIVGEYQITYSSAPSEPINEAYLFRLMYGATEVGTYQPVADIYYDGYRRGIYAFYFSAADYAVLQSLIGVDPWDKTYTIRFEGNPTLSWSGAIPLYMRELTGGGSSWHAASTIAASQALLVIRLRTIAGNIQTSWGVSLLEGTPSRFTTAGVTYFSSAINNLSLMAPGIFPSLITTPNIITREHRKSYAQTLEDRWRGTALERPMYTSLFGLSHMLWKSIGWVILMLFISMAIRSHMEGDTRAIWFISFPALFVGTFLGFIPINFTGLVVAMSFLGLGWLLFYNR